MEMMKGCVAVYKDACQKKKVKNRTQACVRTRSYDISGRDRQQSRAEKEGEGIKTIKGFEERRRKDRKEKGGSLEKSLIIHWRLLARIRIVGIVLNRLLRHLDVRVVLLRVVVLLLVCRVSHHRRLVRLRGYLTSRGH